MNPFWRLSLYGALLFFFFASPEPTWRLVVSQCLSYFPNLTFSHRSSSSREVTISCLTGPIRGLDAQGQLFILFYFFYFKGDIL